MADGTACPGEPLRGRMGAGPGFMDWLPSSLIRARIGSRIVEDGAQGCVHGPLCPAASFTRAHRPGAGWESSDPASFLLARARRGAGEAGA